MVGSKLLGFVKYRLRRARANGQFVGLISLAARLWYLAKSSRDVFYVRDVKRALRGEELPTSPEALVSFVMDRFGGSIAPIQDRWELTELVKRLQKAVPKTVLEIGTARGGTLFLLCQCASEDAQIVSLDLPSGRNGGGFPSWKEPIYRLFKKPAQRLDFIRGDSHSPQSIGQLRKILGARTLDFIMIDGDHSYQGVKTDFEIFFPLLSSNGFIAFHDIAHNKFDAEIDVHRFWAEVRSRYNTEELIRSIGIGILTPRT